ncbi:MAG: gfo/Idh/MocA family oxidoreductase [Caldilinea sp. CFX5]|nr:gfo/Idh/MocA family oxidoreductase [Caldilinea sp. CFX5]
MVKEKLRVGVVGTSWYADLMHLPALKSHPQVQIAAICGRNRDRAEAMAQKYEIPQVFTDYQAMIDQAGIDALVVAIPDDLHYPVTMAALDAGLHVLCEKPLAFTLEQAQQMVARAEEMGVKHMTYFTWRWLPVFQYLHRLIQEGYLGRCFYSQFRYVGGFGRKGQYQWKWDRQRGLGILGDLGVHMIDMAHWCLGDIAKVSAHLPTYIARPGVAGQPLEPANDAALLTLQYADGSQGVIQVSAVAHLGKRNLECQVVLYGEAGTLEVDFNFHDGYVIRGARSGEEQIKALAIPDELLKGVDQTRPFFEQFEQIFMGQPVGTRLFIDAILNDQPVTPSFYDGLKAQAVIAAAMAADRCEGWVAVEHGIDS